MALTRELYTDVLSGVTVTYKDTDGLTSISIFRVSGTVLVAGAKTVQSRPSQPIALSDTVPSVTAVIESGSEGQITVDASGGVAYVMAQ